MWRVGEDLDNEDLVDVIVMPQIKCECSSVVEAVCSIVLIIVVESIRLL